MIDRQALGCLHHAEQKQAGNQTFFGHAVLAHVASLLTQARRADGGELVKHQRQVLIHQGAQQSGDDVVHRFLVRHQSVHAAQQVLMREAGRVYLGQADRFQPAQHAQFGFRVTQAIEDHHAQGVLDGGGVAGFAKH